MLTLNQLHEKLLNVAGRAREEHIDNLNSYTTSRAEVEAILEQLRELYKQDASLFDEKTLADIRIAKICARIINRSDLDRDAIVTAHTFFLQKHGQPNKGTRHGLGHTRITHCYECKNHLDNTIDVECVACGWIVCQCGACGCAYTGYPAVQA